MAAGGEGRGETVQQYRSEVERLTHELAEANREKFRAAECGLVVLEENQTLKQQYADLEAEQETLRQELEQLQEAFSQAYSTQRKVAEDGETNEEALLQESATKEAYYISRLLNQQTELKHSQSQASNTQAENERLNTILQDLRESKEMLELQRSRMREEVREYKFRETRMLQDYSELEEENITLQKLVSTLRQNQVEYEGLKHEIKVLEEETVLLNSQLEDALRLKEISECQLEEALNALKSEREQKNSLRKELAHHITLCDGPFSSACAHLVALSSAPPSGSATPTAATSPGSEDGSKCNGLLLQGSAGKALGRLNGDFRGAGQRKHSDSTTPDLFSELHLNEIQKLKQQLQQVEQEKTSALNSLQECETQLRHSQCALVEQFERAQHLQQRICALHWQGGVTETGDEEKAEAELKGSSSVCDELEGMGLELLQCKYKLAVTDVVSLNDDLKNLQERHKECVERAAREEEQTRVQMQALEAKVSCLECRCREGRDKEAALQRELKKANDSALECNSTLAAAYEELTTFSEELAQLYHHVCMCNNETPNRVMLDYYRQGRNPPRATSTSLKVQDDHRVLLTPRLARRLAAINAATSSTSTPSDSQSPTESPSKDPLNSEDSPARTVLSSYPVSASSSSSSSSPAPDSPAGSDTQREPINLHHLNAIIRDQIKHLQKAVDRSLQLSRQRAAVRELAPLFDKEKEACMEEILKLKSLLSTKREQIATLRLVLKANKQTAEIALSNLKGKYETEKSMVTDTMMKLRNELKALKGDAATFSSLRAMFATRCDEYLTQLDDMQRQLAAAEDEKKTLNSLLRMAIQQKLALTQRLEDLEFDHEQSHRPKLRMAKTARPRTTSPKVSGTATLPLPDTSTTVAEAVAETSPTVVIPSLSSDPGSPPSLEAPSSPASSFSSTWTPPVTPYSRGHTHWMVGMRTFMVEPHSYGVDVNSTSMSRPTSLARRYAFEPLYSSGSQSPSPYRSYRSTWSSPRSRPLSTVQTHSTHTSRYTSPSSSSYGHSSARNYTSHHPRY
ncbi:protein bicaudal D homolog 1-like isoform X1 [Tachysurus fulvidraco]|uniref:protein bicaudal D homolog 1-like isoform X1 n=1 Tax=Tachysurus fulvidraco TaxID=1234273 RepID=UPI000F4EA832|nr:protein bicaudal D homolog 1-like isoform X1 [Tachysurus fulvidraco]XP_047660303.1 protein bicaudal D homolog 1-like isoform X1 [Tachysurus fulvidraco]XP_047660304.1 protein bicaudal D homolog 1-like isoform X1 [Tachysurus fulvidraco]